MRLESYFYLVDAKTQQHLAIFSHDDCPMQSDVASREAQIRVRYGVDEPGSGLLLRDGYTAPLPIEKVKAVLVDMKRKGMSHIWNVQAE